MSYQDFLDSKAQVGSLSGFEPRGVGFELKPSYYQQAVRNLAALEPGVVANRPADMFEAAE